jgi:hypothetical protein
MQTGPTQVTRLGQAVAAACAFACLASPAAAQSVNPRPLGRVSFFTNAARLAPDDASRLTSGEFITSMTYTLADGEGNGLEYGIDLRHSRSTTPGREPRLSLYDGYIGARVAGGRLRVRGGQMWLTDLGALGSVTGALVEFRQAPSVSPVGRFRAGAFAGVEPTMFTFGYVHGIRKIGGYAALEGRAGRRHVAGLVDVSHGQFHERSVFTATNFVPIKSRAFVYQATEYDIKGPGGQGRGGLTYFMMNTRLTVTSRVDLQTLYHRGRSIDARGVTDDLINERPISPTALEGLLFQSAGARLYVQVTGDLRAQVGFSRDRTNHDSAPTDRVTYGASTSNLARTGVDVTVTESRIDRPTGRYTSHFASVGRQIGRLVYLSGDYSTSLSVARFTRSDGVTIETRPRTRRLSASAVVYVGRHVSLLATCDRTRDDTSSELRVLSGLTYRFR